MASHIAAAGGISGAGYMRDPGSFRASSLKSLRAEYAGKSPAEATRIATGRGMAPIRVDIHPGDKHVELRDGRHRMTTAKEAGAGRHRAEVRVYGKRGGYVTWRGNIKI